MEISEFIVKFKEQFIDAESIEVNDSTLFRKIESYDSLTGMAILVMIQDEFDLIISEDIYKTLNTPKELFDYILSNK
jgi:acyl carrier protein